MKTIEKISLTVFSIIMIIISILNILFIFGWISASYVSDFLQYLIADDILSKVSVGISILFILLGIKCLFFDSDSKNEEKEGLILQNENGSLLITKDTLENLISEVISGFSDIEVLASKVCLEKNNTIKIFINLSITTDAVIKELIINIQSKIKESIKQSTDLDVTEVNVKVKNIIAKKIIQE